MDFEVNQKIRVKTAPDKEGRITGKVRKVSGRNRWQVDFGVNREYILESNLEVIDDAYDIYDLIDNAKYGSVYNLRSSVTHKRLTGRLADVVYSMESTNTEFYPYQFRPVLNFLDSPSRGLLIADEVGLGKTIEAGLIWTELRSRIDARRLLILCPAVLREKWREELAHRFGVRADICNADEFLSILKQYKSGATSSFCAIASFQGLRPEKDWQDGLRSNKGRSGLASFLQDQESEGDIIDCVIIDESHYIRNPSTQTHKLARMLRYVSDNMILLSATPIQLRSDDLYHQLNLIDEESFQHIDAFRDVLEANQPLVELSAALRSGSIVQSVVFKEGISRCLEHHLFDGNRQLHFMLNNPPNDEQLQKVALREEYATRIERVNLLARVVSRTRKRDVHENRVVREPIAPHIEMNDCEKMFYAQVTETVRKYCIGRDLVEGFILTIPQRQMCSSMPAALRAWSSASEARIDEDELYENEGSVEGISKKTTIGPLIGKLSSVVSELSTFEDLKDNDSKYAQLKESLDDYSNIYPDKKVIIFSYYRETIRYLTERLNEDGYEVQVLVGGMRESKHDLIEKFKSSTTTRILLASEVASEGVDIQFCSMLINYDLPWNPMRVEQRIGRIDRIGQKENKINILNYFYSGTLDEKIYHRLYERLDVFRHALGDLEAVLGERIRSLTQELLMHNLNEQQEEDRIEQTQLAIARQKREQEELEQEAAHLTAHGDYVLNKVKAAKEMRRFIDGRHLWVYVKDYLESKYRGSKLVRVNDEPLEVDMELSTDAKSDLQFFLEKDRNIGRTALASGYGGKPVRCVFSNQVDFSTHSYEVINQHHPLIRFITSRICSENYYPLTAGVVNRNCVPDISAGIYLVVVNQWSTSGAKTVERLVYKGISLSDKSRITDDDAEKLVAELISSGSDWRDIRSKVASNEVSDAYDLLTTELDDQFMDYASRMEMENHDYIDYLVGVLEEKKRTQIERIEGVIQEQKSRGETRMIKANEGRIRKLQESLDVQKVKYEKRRDISTDQQHVSTGVIYVS